MRLICPNCAAEYEIDSAAIPQGGRDVICSACGHGWFFGTPDAPAPLALTEPAAPGTVAETRRRALDAAVVSILREEADREAKARQADAPARPSAPALNADATGAPPETPEPTPDPLPERAPDAPPAGSRPQDIGDITSTLHATARLRAAERQAGRRRGFGLGFGFVTGAAAALVALYLLAPTIAREWPATAPAAAAFTQQVDAARAWLDSSLRAAGIQPRP